MKRQGSLTRTGPSPSRILPIFGCLLAGLAVALASVLVLPGCTQQPSGGFTQAGREAMAQPAAPGVYEIITRLDLEPEQLPAVRTVLEDAEDAREEAHSEMMAQADGARPDPSVMAAMRETMDDLNESTEDKLADLLTADQMSEYREMMEEVEQERDASRPSMGGRGGRGGKGGR